jgi:hypothetical protein
VKLRTSKSRTAERLRSRDISELAVMVRFGELVVAVAADRVSRIVMADEAVPAQPRSTPCVRIGDAMLPAWNMGTLLGFSDPPVAWLIMTTSSEPSAPEIALGTGPCVAVASHDGVTPLPAGVLSAPPAAVVGVFVTDEALRERGIGPLGVRVDPMRLIGSSMLAAARRDHP